jgi:hypothetical protein
VRDVAAPADERAQRIEPRPAVGAAGQVVLELLRLLLGELALR